jgi:citrate/tricarballylate utilization protein
MSINELFIEAERQMNVCNSCRYCEGYCPVWPTLESLPEINGNGLLHLSNLCHDCRDCHTACMYTAPHEFALNPPEVFSAIRVETYRDYSWPARPGWARGARGVAALACVAVIVLIALAALLHGATGTAQTLASPYRLLPHWVLVGIVSAPVVWGIVVTIVAGWRYWRDIHGPLRSLARPVAWLRTLTDGLRLKHMRGGGAECTYPGDEPSTRRRTYHMWLVGGLFLCLLSTTAAGVQEEILGWQPPYPFLSVPPLTGTLGGIAMVVGSAGLLAEKRRSREELSAPAMQGADYALLWSLMLLAVTGLLTLLLRSTPLFFPVLVIHLASVLTCFTVAPYSKFMHFVYRLLSIYKFRLDSAVTGDAH